MEGRFEDNGFAPHRLSTLHIFWLLFIFYPESMQLDLQRTWGVMLPFPIQEWVFKAFAVLWFNPLEAASLHIHFPSCRVLHIFPISHVCTAWLYTWQVLSLLYYSYSLILEEPDQLNYCTKSCTKCSRVVKGWLREIHFSWRSRVTSAAVIVSVFYIHWKKNCQETLIWKPIWDCPIFSWTLGFSLTSLLRSLTEEGFEHKSLTFKLSY